MKKIICLDFDGVINSYKSGWTGIANLPDEPVPGALEWIEKIIMLYCDTPESIDCIGKPLKDYELCIYSARSKSFFGRRAMKKWLVKHGLDDRFLEVIKFPIKKPAAFITIDDRAIQFKGKFPKFEEITNFKPWNKKKV